MSADAQWSMVEDAVFHLFDELATESQGGRHLAIGPRLDELGWSDIEAEYPTQSSELLFRAQGRSLAHTDCLNRVILAALGALFDGPVDGVVLPNPVDGCVPSSTEANVSGVLLGPLTDDARLVVPVAGPKGNVSIGVVDASTLTSTRLDTFDSSSCWTSVDGPLDTNLIASDVEWNRAVAAAHRALASELVALADEALRIAVEHISVRTQFGAPIGSFQSPRHLLAEAKANLEGARALLAESWRDGGEHWALAAKAAAGRAHRAVSDATLQVCGAIGLTAEHDLHRYVTRGFQLDSLFGSYDRLEALLGDRLFDEYTPGHALPAIIT